MSSSQVGLAVDIVRSDDAFVELRSVWNRLAGRVVPETVFLQHEWFDAAWQWVRSDAELCVITVRKHGEIIGVIPLMRRLVRQHGVKVRVIEFLSVADAETCDAIASTADMANTVDAFVAFLESADFQWDKLRLVKLAKESEFLRHLVARLDKSRLGHSIENRGFVAGLSLTDSWEEYYGRRSRRLKKGNNHAANKIKRVCAKPDINWIRAGSATAAELQAALENVITVSSQSWKTGVGNTLDQPGPLAFVRRLAEHATREGWLSIWLLCLDGKIAATELQLAYKGHVSALRADFSPEFEDLSPGTFLNWKILEGLFDASLDNYTMGPGQNAYKMRWAETSAEQTCIDVFAPSLRGRYLQLIDKRARPVVRWLRQFGK